MTTTPNQVYISLACVSFNLVIPKSNLIVVHQRILLQHFVPLSSKVGRWLGRRALSGNICPRHPAVHHKVSPVHKAALVAG